MNPEIVAITALLVLLMVVVLSDALQRKIYNANIALLFLVATGYRFMQGSPFWLDATLYALIVCVVGMLLWQYGLLGAGDVKLAAVCAWIVFPNWFELVLLSAFGAGILAVWQLARAYFATSNVHQGTVPLGVSISASTAYLIL
ncbi:TPA: prepilin peptidase [Vibrio vulnificus]|uniref:prepilin peptidase n=1 Tax=Vibrio vulnificus TaxID=672 RepID=UPI00102A76BC|nr:A24 family peptidase [Vibrio vulnificus]EGQ7998245.1 prepilin peptidase [Vibrio vulnificus]EIV8493821.1 prepilin peptidase [Vibrio vulnificus]EJT1339382.1 prepilin peptidase [Vibrio vulnificus]ELV8673141.1 prepilin peptidase [Vibrio vulnificus]ELV8744455.1 prepilin peptidase [Vibrio vulnificus]